MADHYTRRRQELERMNQQALHEQEQQRRRQEGYYEDTWARPNNTLGPNEDVVEKRRYRKHVAISAGNGRPSNALKENVGLLVLLLILVGLLYHACIYMLNQ